MKSTRASMLARDNEKGAAFATPFRSFLKSD